MLARRAFLTGLLAAPLVASSANLMTLRGILMPRASVRWLAAYEIGTDQIVARRDVLYGTKLRDMSDKFGRGVWGLDAATEQRLENFYSVVIRDMDLQAMKNPGVQKSMTLGLRDHYSFDHAERLLSWGREANA